MVRGWPYIPDKAVFAAVMFAYKLMRQGMPPSVANTRAANHYRVSVSQVAHYTGMVGGKCAQRRRQNRK